jgi:branched-chain amino acid transport system ATP-binding protein
MGLAPLVVEKLFRALEELTAAGVGLLIVEQYVARALEMATRAVLLDRGRVSFNGLASDLDEDEVLRAYLGADITPHDPSA